MNRTRYAVAIGSIMAAISAASLTLKHGIAIGAAGGALIGALVALIAWLVMRPRTS